MSTALAKTSAPAKRLASMLRHMAIYYTVSDALPEARLCLLAAHDVESDFARSRVVQLVAENTRRWLADMADGALQPAAPGASSLIGADRLSWRQQLKSRFFAGLQLVYTVVCRRQSLSGRQASVSDGRRVQPAHRVGLLRQA